MALAKIKIYQEPEPEQYCAGRLPRSRIFVNGQEVTGVQAIETICDARDMPFIHVKLSLMLHRTGLEIITVENVDELDGGEHVKH
jgi:hypothetical protein